MKTNHPLTDAFEQRQPYPREVEWREFARQLEQAAAAHPAAATKLGNGEALPCPFCGGVAALLRRNVGGSVAEKYLYWYACARPGCGVAFTDGEWSVAEALRRWNERQNEKADLPTPGK